MEESHNKRPCRKVGRAGKDAIKIYFSEEST